MTALIRGVKVNYVISGEGEYVLCLHGWGGSIAGFKGFADFLSRKYAVINLDLPPFGESGELGGEVWGVENYAALVKSLLVMIGASRVSIVAHSFGGRIALYLAAHYPQMINKLILTGCAGIKPRRGISYHIKVARFRRMRRRGGDLSAFGSADYRALPQAMRATFTKIVNEDLTPLLGKITAPTLLLWGDTDTDTPPYMARKMHRRISGSELVYLSGGHYAYIQRHMEFCHTVLYWLGAGTA